MEYRRESAGSGGSGASRRRSSVAYDESLSTKENAKNMAKKAFDLTMWEKIACVSFGVVALLAIAHFAIEDFGSLIVWGAVFQTLGHVLILARVITSQSAEGISMHAQIVYCAIYLMRPIVNIVYDEYLPTYEGADWLYQLMELISLVTCCATLVVAYKTEIKSSIKDEKINPQHAGVVLGGVLLLSVFCRVGRCQSFFFDVLYTLANHLEPVAIIPQIFLIANKGRTRVQTGHSLAFIFVARVMTLLWMIEYWDPLMYPSKNPLPVLLLVLSQLAAVIFLADFIWIYGKQLVQGGMRRMSFGV